jgi:K+-sensing histidine kinase KdpD
MSGAVGGVLGLPAGAVAAIAAWAFAGDPTTGLVFAAGAAVLLAAMTTTVGAVVTASLSWACYDGFVLHRFGTLEGGRGDLIALGIVLGAALAARAVTGVIRQVRTAESRRDYPANVPPEVRLRIRSMTR